MKSWQNSVTRTLYHQCNTFYAIGFCCSFLGHNSCMCSSTLEHPLTFAYAQNFRGFSHHDLYMTLLDCHTSIHLANSACAFNYMNNFYLICSCAINYNTYLLFHIKQLYFNFLRVRCKSLSHSNGKTDECFSFI